jgi:hypothetical protein
LLGLYLLKDLELGPELIYLHLLVDLHVAILSPHRPVEQLIEVDISIVTLDAHLEQLFLQLSFVILFYSEPELLVLFSEKSEKLAKILFPDLLTVVFLLCQLLPDFHEGDLIILKPVKHVIFWQVVLFKLLDDN